MEKRGRRRIITVSLLVIAGILLPATVISILLLILFVYQSQTKAFLQSLIDWQTAELKQYWRAKKSAFRKFTLRLALGMLLVNVVGWVFGKNMGRHGEEPETFPLLFHTVSVQAETFSYAGGDNGMAQITVIAPGGKKEFEAGFNYDLLADTSPVSVNYGFYTFDLFPDILLDSTAEDYVISGFSGNIYPHYSLLTSLIYQ